MSRSSRRGPWLPEEDATLLHLVRTQGPNNWVRISQHMQHRSPKQCRERYHQNLKPSLNHEPISAHEGEAIEQLVHEMGKRWAEIARRLGNRSDNAVKNWWNGSMNRRKRSTVQQGSGSKMVGHRSQPIPASAPLPPQQRHLYSHEQPACMIFSVLPPFHRHETSTGSIFGPGPRYSAPPQPQRHHLQGQTDQRPLSFPQHDQSPISPLHPHLNTFSLPNPVGNTLPGLHNWSKDRAEYQLAPLQRVEAPATSPAATEVSQGSSHQQAPSLVSDNQSNYSISPRTVTSPRPGTTATKVASMELWPEMQRRNSTGNYPDAEIDARGERRPEDDLQIYRSAGTLEHLFPKVTGSPALPRPMSLPDPTISRTRLNKAGWSSSNQNDRMNSSQEKDSRMTVSRLLE